MIEGADVQRDLEILEQTLGGPALTLYLSSQERLVVQCNDQARFARELRGAWETIRQDPARVT